jgi:predicted AAA+ superfamily ATPase
MSYITQRNEQYQEMIMNIFRRSMFHILLTRLWEPRRFIQVLSGPRQVGKTTLARQVGDELSLPMRYVSADEPTLQGRAWLSQQWEIARMLTRDGQARVPALLIIDEIQKVPGWSETVKRLWDEDTATDIPLRVLLSGSSPLLIQTGLTESLAGRFELLPVSHWSFAEMQTVFGWSVEQYIYFGGYPGAAGLIADESRWRRYIIDSLIETTLSRDILLMTRVDKPALLRRMFHLACEYSGRILSYQKMLGQLHDAGNTTTLAHYLDLLGGAGLAKGLSKYSGQKVRQRASSPKLQVLNTALMTALDGRTFAAAQMDRDYWGRLVESAVGAHLLNSSDETGIDVSYWFDSNREVDFVLSMGRKVVGIEVKSGQKETTLPGMAAFARSFDVHRQLLVGAQGISLAEFFSEPASHWIE